METEEIINRINKIKETAARGAAVWEDAHILEDKLFVDFIKYIFKEAPEPFRTKAKQVLKSQKIEFDRICS